MTSGAVTDPPARAGGDLAMALAVGAGAYGSLDSMLNVAFPDLVSDLGLAVTDVQWIVIAFVLASGGALIGAGRLGDLVGHGRTLGWGGILSAIGLLCCAAAPGLGALVAGRVIQGLGTALVMASTPALVAAAAGEGGKGRALGLFQMSAAVGLALGPLLAGPLVGSLGWRSVFWVRVPMGLGVGLLARRQTVPIRATPSALGGPALLAATLAALLVSLDLGLSVGGGAVVVVLGLVGLVLAVILVRHQRAAADPVIALDLLGQPAFLVANLLAVAANGAAFVGWLFVPGYVVNELGRPTIVGGLVLASAPAATALVAPMAGKLSDRFGPATVAAAGLGVLSVGLGTAGWVVSLRSALALALALALVGVGLGRFTVPNMAYVFSSLPQDRQGVAGGVVLTMRTVGIVVGVALLSDFFQANEARGFPSALGRTFVVAGLVTTIGALVSGLRLAGRYTSSAQLRA